MFKQQAYPTRLIPRFSGRCLGLFILAVVWLALAVPASAVVYVNPSPTAPEDGNTWASGWSSLQAGIDDADVLNEQVWVMSGEYVELITLKDGVSVYGGFIGTETAVDQRDWIANETIINANNSGQAVMGANNAVLDGFTVTNGFADGGVPEIGGGITCTNTSPTIQNCLITGNSTNNLGGGIGLNNSNARFVNCVITNNVATPAAYGGGAYCFSSSPFFINCTFTGNYAASGGGGITYAGPASTSVVTVYNTILWGDSVGTGSQEVNSGGGLATFAAYNSDIDQVGFTGSNGNIRQNPAFSVSDPYFHIASSSPCIDVGNNTVPGGLPSTDIDGGARIKNVVVDMGADEYDPLPAGVYHVSVTSGNDVTGDGSISAPWKTLHHALDMINGGAAGGYTLNVAAGTYSLANGEVDDLLYVWQNNVVIRGAGADTTIIDGSGGSMWLAAFYVEADGVNIQNLAIRNFLATGGTGAYYAYTSAGEVSDCTIRSCYLGINMENAHPQILRNTIHNNIVGVYVYNDDGAYPSSPIIAQNRFYDNDNTLEVFADGAGTVASPSIWNNLFHMITGTGNHAISLYDSASGTASPTIYHNTIDGASAWQYGLYIDLSSGTSAPVIKYNIITGAVQYGVYVNSGTPTFDYNDVWGNSAGNFFGATAGAHGISVNPLLSSYRPLASSPCINAIPTTDTDPVVDDKDGVSRPQGAGFDMGCYEFTGSNVQTHSVTILPGTTAADYVSLSLPMKLADARPTVVFGPQIGTYDPTLMRLGHWEKDIQAYKEYPGDDGSILPGDAAWFLFRNGKTLTFTGTPTPTTTGPMGLTGYALEIKQGWNQIGNPFLFPIAVSDFVVTDQGGAYEYMTSPSNTITQQVFWVYSHGEYLSATRLDTAQGGWVKKLTPGQGSIFYQANPAFAPDAPINGKAVSADLERPPAPMGDLSPAGGSASGGGGGCFIDSATR